MVRALSPLYALAFVHNLTHYRPTIGIHPELIHLDEELSTRRDKRIELASRRRTYEVNDATKRKRAAENAVWGWWKVPSCLDAHTLQFTCPAVRARRTSS